MSDILRPRGILRELSSPATIFLRCTSLTTDGHAISSPSIRCRSSGVSTPRSASASAYNLASLALIPHLSVSHGKTSPLTLCSSVSFAAKASCAAACRADAVFEVGLGLGLGLGFGFG